MARKSGEQPRPVVGLALGGGAALGWAHIGALRVLRENEVPVGAIAGTSIGALVGACTASDVLEPLEDIARGMTWRRLLGYADPQMGAPGIFKGGAIIGTMERYLGARRIEELDLPFAAVASDLISGEEVRIRTGLLTEAVRASISIPGIFLPVERNGALLVDGGLLNPVPVSAAREMGADIVIAIDVTGDYHGRARAAGLMLAGPGPVGTSRAAGPGWVSGMAERLFRRSERRPGLYSVATASAALMMRELALAKLACDPPDVHVVPQVGHISPVEFDRADDLIEAGKSAMQAQMASVRALITERPQKRAK